jgi:TrmH family RNA methyltransferase
VNALNAPAPSSLAGIVVVLVRTEGPLNLGSVARLCGNFGVQLRLVDVRADATSRQAIMMAHPSEHILANAPRFATLQEALVDVELAVGTSSKIAVARDGPSLDVERGRALLPSAPNARIAFVFGNERTGMLVDEAALCHRTVRLEVPGPEPSMNLSHAVAVVLEILALAALVDAEPRATTAKKEALFREWSSTLEGAGYFKQATPESFAPRLREIVDKMDVSERDVELLLGMLRVLSKPPPTP